MTQQLSVPDLRDPVAFARQLYAKLGTGRGDRIRDAAPPAGQAFKEAMQALTMGGLSPDAGCPNVLLAQAARAWAADCHRAGVEFGVAAERLRPALLVQAEEAAEVDR